MYTLADLTRISGLKRRTVQLWAEGGALIAEPATERQGSGVHRLFSRSEAIICVMLAQLGSVSPPIGRLKFMAGLIRKELRRKHSLFLEDIESVISGEKAGAVLGFQANGQVIGFFDTGDHRLELAMPREGNEMIILVYLDKALRALRSV
jgi:hypothetical protein